MENRNTNTVELPSGAQAEILTRWTFDEYLKIEEAQLRMARGFSVTGVGGETTAEINHGAMRTFKIVTLMTAVKKLTLADGTDVPVTEQALGELDMADGLELYRVVDEIAGQGKKK